jgi:hypothetical protein
MPKFIVDLWLDGYETDEELEKACEEFIYEQLNFTASSVKITKLEELTKPQGGDTRSASAGCDDE